MDPNINQPLTGTQVQQAPTQPAETPKKGHGKVLILLFLLLLLIAGMAVYILFVQNQAKNVKNTIGENSTVVPSSIPSPTESVSPSPAQDDLNIENPQADLQGIEADVQGL